MLVKENIHLVFKEHYQKRLGRGLTIYETYSTKKGEWEAGLRHLRTTLEQLYGYTDICTFPHEVLAEFAEILHDIKYETAETMDEFIDMTLTYADKQIAKWKMENEKYNRVFLSAQKTMKDKVKLMDITYQAWLYREGYHYQRKVMYELIISTMRALREEHEKQQKKLAKKRDRELKLQEKLQANA